MTTAGVRADAREPWTGALACAELAHSLVPRLREAHEIADTLDLVLGHLAESVEARDIEGITRAALLIEGTDEESSLLSKTSVFTPGGVDQSLYVLIAIVATRSIAMLFAAGLTPDVPPWFHHDTNADDDVLVLAEACGVRDEAERMLKTSRV